METNTEITHARLDELHPNPYQPESRLEVKDGVAREFGISILENGLLQIPVCRAVNTGGGNFELQMVEGWHRRAGFAWLVANGHPEYKRMPVQIRPFTDEQMADMVYIANKVRKDLSPIDLAWYYKKYLAEFKSVTQESLAKKLDLSQSEISNTMRLLDLPGRVQELIIAQEITESHGRALLQLKEPALMIEYAEEAVKNGWPVSTLDGVIKTYIETHKLRLPEPPPVETEAPEEETSGPEEEAEEPGAEIEAGGVSGKRESRRKAKVK